MTATILIVALQPDTPSGRAARPGDTGQHGSRPILPAAVHIVRCQRQDYSHRAALTAKPGVHRKGKTGGFPCVPVQSLKQYDNQVCDPRLPWATRTSLRRSLTDGPCDLRDRTGRAKRGTPDRI
jgi:hypothetical protein